MLVLVPVTLFCFAIMARRSTKPLSIHFLLLNALLLLPIRSSMAAGTIALVAIVYALFVMGKLTRDDLAMKTGEGKFALATLIIPPGIILFRSMYFYQVDSLMVATVAMALFLAARQASQFPDRSARLATALEVVSWPLAMIVALALTGAFEPGISSGLKAPVFSLTYAALALDELRQALLRDGGLLSRQPLACGHGGGFVVLSGVVGQDFLQKAGNRREFGSALYTRPRSRQRSLAPRATPVRRTGSTP